MKAFLKLCIQVTAIQENITEIFRFHKNRHLQSARMENPHGDVVSFTDYIVISPDTKDRDGLNYNVGEEIFFKVNRFYQNKCMERDSKLWQCQVDKHRIFLQKSYLNYHLQISDETKFYREIIHPTVERVYKKGMSFLKRIVFQTIHDIPDTFPARPTEYVEVNELSFQITNLKLSESFRILLSVITDLFNNIKTYKITYVTENARTFSMLLPIYLFDKDRTTNTTGTLGDGQDAGRDNIGKHIARDPSEWSKRGSETRRHQPPYQRGKSRQVSISADTHERYNPSQIHKAVCS